jgi:hypothetical protein
MQLIGRPSRGALFYKTLGNQATLILASTLGVLDRFVVIPATAKRNRHRSRRGNRRCGCRLFTTAGRSEAASHREIVDYGPYQIASQILKTITSVPTDKKVSAAA